MDLPGLLCLETDHHVTTACRTSAHLACTSKARARAFLSKFGSAARQGFLQCVWQWFLLVFAMFAVCRRDLAWVKDGKFTAHTVEGPRFSTQLCLVASLTTAAQHLLFSFFHTR